MKRRRQIILVVATVFLCFAVLSARALWEGRDALDKGQTAMAEGDGESAVRWLRRAARWYVPLAPHVGEAYESLEALATAAEQSGDPALALAAWTGIRSSVRATRSFYTPHEERMQRADVQIARLMAAQELASAPDSDPKAREAWHYALLQKNAMPSVGWSIVALLGLALWVGGGFGFALRGVDDQDKLVPKAAAYSGAAIAIGLLVWLTGLYLA